MSISCKRHPWHPIAACAAALCAGTVLAATEAATAAQTEAQARYRQDVQACKSGRTAQDTATCLKEARHALAARQRGQLATDTGELEANRLQRCEVFDGQAKADCIARMSPHATVSGSVAGGGILREVETIVVPPNQGPVRIMPRTDDPVIVVPTRKP